MVLDFQGPVGPGFPGTSWSSRFSGTMGPRFPGTLWAGGLDFQVKLLNLI